MPDNGTQCPPDHWYRFCIIFPCISCIEAEVNLISVTAAYLFLAWDYQDQYLKLLLIYTVDPLLVIVVITHRFLQLFIFGGSKQWSIKFLKLV